MDTASDEAAIEAKKQEVEAAASTAAGAEAAAEVGRHGAVEASETAANNPDDWPALQLQLTAAQQGATAATDAAGEAQTAATTATTAKGELDGAVADMNAEITGLETLLE